MKKNMLIIFACAVLFSLAGCGQSVDSQTQAEVPNPVTEVTQQQLLEKTGISFAVPEGVENVIYSYIDTGDGQPATAQMCFSLDGIDYTARAVSSDVPGDTLPDISGLYYDWEQSDTAQVGYNSAQLFLNEGEQGYVTWYDYAPGLLYCVSMGSGASADALTAIAVQCCPPLQGEA